MIARAAALLRHLHGSGAAFRGRVDPGEAIAAYPDWQATAAAAGLPAVPSHNDPVLDNLLLDGERTLLIDWEFSAMASPLWDLATLANAANLGPAACRLLLESYCVGGSRVEESALYAFRNLLALLDDCWMAALIGQ